MCLPLISVLDADIVVPSLNIELGEVFCVLEFVNKIRDERERVGIPDDVLI